MFVRKIIIILFFFLGLQIFWGVSVRAKNMNYQPEVKIPDINIVSVDGEGRALSDYVSAFYKLAIGLTGILATIMIAVAGITWITSGGNAGQIGKARQMIGGALTGLVLALFSYALLYNINPEIVKLKFSGVSEIANIKAGCSWQKTECNIAENMLAENVDKCGGNIEEHKGEYCCCRAKREGCCLVKRYENDQLLIDECIWTTLDICKKRKNKAEGVQSFFFSGTICDKIENCKDSLINSSICTKDNIGISCGDEKVCDLEKGFPACVECVKEGNCNPQVGSRPKCCAGYICKDTGKWNAFLSSFGIGDGRFQCVKND